MCFHKKKKLLLKKVNESINKRQNDDNHRKHTHKWRGRSSNFNHDIKTNNFYIFISWGRIYRRNKIRQMLTCWIFASPTKINSSVNLMWKCFGRNPRPNFRGFLLPSLTKSLIYVQSSQEQGQTNKYGELAHPDGGNNLN